MAKLFVVNRKTEEQWHRHVGDLPEILGENDVLVFTEQSHSCTNSPLRKEEIFLF